MRRIHYRTWMPGHGAFVQSTKEYGDYHSDNDYTYFYFSPTGFLEIRSSDHLDIYVPHHQILALYEVEEDDE